MKSRSYEERGIHMKRQESKQSGYKSGYTLPLPIVALAPLRRLRFVRGIWK